jgi:ABC-type polysaccharide/polyol phosphate export permease
MKKFVRDIKKYHNYMFFSAKAQLQNEVAGSFLNWLWWILNPLLFMLVYTFVYTIVFGKQQDYLCAFIFIGISCWNFFNNSINSSVKIIKQYKSVISKVYVPKFVLVGSMTLVNGFKLLISLALSAIAMLIYRVPLSITMLWLIPLVLLLYLLTTGFGLLLLHCGVFVEDLANLVNVALRLVFYLSGIFYNIETALQMDDNLRYALIHLNPICFIITALRNSVLYGQNPSVLWVIGWFAASAVIFVLAIKLVYKYERRYVKSV